MEIVSSEQRFKHIYDEYWDILYRIANKKTNSHHDALDIVQDTFTYIWSNSETLQKVETGKVRSYLITCLYYRIMNFFRTKGIRNKHLQFFQVQNDNDSLLTIPHNTEDTEEELMAINVAIMAELDKMPERMKSLFLQNHIHDKSVHELAIEYNISDKTVSNQISMAKKKLKDFARSYPRTELMSLILLFLMKD